MATEAEHVYTWRVTLLMQLGVSEELAFTHANEINPHEVEDLIERSGCDPDYAVEFLVD